MFISLLIALAFLLVVVFVISQVLAPALTATPLFPMFRKSRIKLEQEVAQLRGSLEDEKLSRYRDELAAKLAEKQVAKAVAEKQA